MILMLKSYYAYESSVFPAYMFVNPHLISVCYSHHLHQLFCGQLVHLQLARVQVLQKQLEQLRVCIMNRNFSVIKGITKLNEYICITLKAITTCRHILFHLSQEFFKLGWCWLIPLLYSVTFSEVKPISLQEKLYSPFTLASKVSFHSKVFMSFWNWILRA